MAALASLPRAMRLHPSKSTALVPATHQYLLLNAYGTSINASARQSYQSRFPGSVPFDLKSSQHMRPETRRSTLSSSSCHTFAGIYPSPQPLSALLHNNHLRKSTTTTTITASTSPTSISPYRAFHTTRTYHKDHHFDTLKFIQRLRSEGFTEDQCTAILSVLSEAISESVQNLTRTMVPREDALKSSYTQKVDFSALRTELLALDSSESALTRASHERLSNELAKLNSRLRDEVNRTQASVRLDLNLEKGRIREENNVQELKIKETETRIEQEVAALRERIEGVKFSTLQWLMGVCTGTAALILGAWRLLM